MLKLLDDLVFQGLFQGCEKYVKCRFTRVFQGCFRGVARVLIGYLWVFHGNFKDILGVFHLHLIVV